MTGQLRASAKVRLTFRQQARTNGDFYPNRNVSRSVASRPVDLPRCDPRVGTAESQTEKIQTGATNEKNALSQAPRCMGSISSLLMILKASRSNCIALRTPVDKVDLRLNSQISSVL